MRNLLRLFRRPGASASNRRGEITQQFLIDTSVVLASSLDYQTTLNTIVHLATSTVADWCLIDLVTESGSIERAAIAHRDPAKLPLAHELQRKYPLIDVGGKHTILNVVRTAQSWFDPDVSPERLRGEARDDEHWRLLRELGFTSEIVVPLIAREKTLGTLSLILGEGERRYSQQDLIAAEELGRRVALAIDNAQLYLQAEAQRKQFETVMTRYRDLVENANDIIYTLDMAGNVTSINGAGEEITGYTRDEILNTSVERIVVPDYHYLMDQMLAHKTDGEAGRTRYELEIVTKDGQLRTLEVNSQLILQDNVPIGVQGIARDITERKLAEKRAQELQATTTMLYQVEQKARMEAEEANRLKLQFLAMISHELRTPLTSIKGFTSTLLADDVTWDTETQRDFLNIVDIEADRLTALIGELLDLSKLHAGKLAIAPENAYLPDIIDSSKAELDVLAQHHRLSISIPSDLPPVLADSHRITQVLTNLVSNAAKYSEAGTAITIHARVEGDYIQLDVADEGLGIPPNAREIVFEAFKQGNGVKKGAGLGLAICKGLIEAHGGRIWVQDRQPPGTTISFTLPVVRSPQTK